MGVTVSTVHLCLISGEKNIVVRQNIIASTLLSLFSLTINLQLFNSSKITSGVPHYVNSCHVDYLEMCFLLSVMSFSELTCTHM